MTKCSIPRRTGARDIACKSIAFEGEQIQPLARGTLNDDSTFMWNRITHKNRTFIGTRSGRRRLLGATLKASALRG